MRKRGNTLFGVVRCSGTLTSDLHDLQPILETKLVDAGVRHVVVVTVGVVDEVGHISRLLADRRTDGRTQHYCIIIEGQNSISSSIIEFLSI